MEKRARTILTLDTVLLPYSSKRRLPICPPEISHMDLPASGANHPATIIRAKTVTANINSAASLRFSEHTFQHSGGLLLIPTHSSKNQQNSLIQPHISLLIHKHPPSFFGKLQLSMVSPQKSGEKKSARRGGDTAAGWWVSYSVRVRTYNRRLLGIRRHTVRRTSRTRRDRPYRARWRRRVRG